MGAKNSKIQGLLAAGLFAGAMAADAVLVTVDANNFASGTDISNATPGVTLSTFSSNGQAIGALPPAAVSPIYAATDPDCISPTPNGNCTAVVGANVFASTRRPGG